MRNIILAVNELSKHFVLHILDGKVITGCAGVSFSLQQGEFLGIAGPSGAGKSTVIKCIYRTYLPSGGNVLYRTAGGREVDLARAPEREVIRLRRLEIGYASQFLKVMPRVPAVDVLAGELRRKGWDMERARARAREYLAIMNIDRPLWDAYPSTFSGGEQQRINLARALITAPRLLLLDEPTASLDPETKKIVIRILRDVKEQGTGIIGIFHDYDVMRRLVDRVFTMQSGRCSQAGDRREGLM
ncbi:phosphonate C-P lyase system protein PhnL [Desulfotomaculum copahuensis]|uniref:Phosphonate C-P lyase system protein PhnL n=1 Tax=Desulfotomaculum copahuensis TaxID=1838280 RepID=A0A1B7LH01_9FIRM|nr:phosphonate C-P lyase system protein PhnL [Desulfotomaculum copahuensis]OAT85472.1 phosphonate C-P lyase system protein PhnL [Desulfotomaculum copahuensis]